MFRLLWHRLELNQPSFGVEEYVVEDDGDGSSGLDVALDRGDAEREE